MSDAHSIPAGSDHVSGPGNGSGPGQPPEGRQLVHAAVVADAHQVHAPGALLLEGSRVLACGSPAALGPPPPGTELIERPGELLLPPLVNAHAHLDLTALSAPPAGGAFGDWLTRVGAHRTEQRADGAVEAAVASGVEASLAGGCPFVGDICGSRRALAALQASCLGGVGYIEFLGHDARAHDAATAIGTEAAEGGFERNGAGELAIGLSPHALYSTGPEVFRAAAGSGCQVATHLAESIDEQIWCLEGSGVFAEMLEHVGYPPGTPGHPGEHPVDAMLGLLNGDRVALVHLNYIEPRHLEALAASGVTVVYCPRASHYFGHPHEGHPPHLWREMLAHGIPVALGTDGRPCLPGPGVRGRRLSVLDDALSLESAAGALLEEWLPMATIHGARALGIDPDEVTFAPAPKRGVLAIALAGGEPARPDPEAELQWLFFDEEASVRSPGGAE